MSHNTYPPVYFSRLRSRFSCRGVIRLPRLGKRWIGQIDQPVHRAPEANQSDQQTRQSLPNEILLENRQPHFRILPRLKSDRYSQGSFPARGRFPLPQSVDGRLIEEFVPCRLDGLDVRHVTLRVEGQPKSTRA
jgi:hypothetical protein